MQRNSTLTGIWNGQFSYPRRLEPEFFVATLLETPEWVSGSTQETMEHGPFIGKTLYATLSGRRNGHAVEFTKNYESTMRMHRVHYSGTLSSDETEIEGIWTIPGNWSGKFLMIRSSGIPLTVTKSVFEPV